MVEKIKMSIREWFEKFIDIGDSWYNSNWTDEEKYMYYRLFINLKSGKNIITIFNSGSIYIRTKKGSLKPISINKIPNDMEFEFYTNTRIIKSGYLIVKDNSLKVLNDFRHNVLLERKRTTCYPYDYCNFGNKKIVGDEDDYLAYSDLNCIIRVKIFHPSAYSIYNKTRKKYGIGVCEQNKNIEEEFKCFKILFIAYDINNMESNGIVIDKCMQDITKGFGVISYVDDGLRKPKLSLFDSSCRIEYN